MKFNIILRKSILFIGILGILVTQGCHKQNQSSLDNELAYRKVGISRLEEGDYEGAEEAFQKALNESFAKVRDLEIDICYYKAIAQIKNDNIKGAIKTYTALIDYDSKNPDPYFLRGSLYLKEQDKKKADADYSKSIEMASDDIELYVNIYENLTAAGYEEDGIEYLEKALDIKGSKASDYRGKGRVYLVLKDYDNAIKQLDQAIELKDKEAVLFLAQAYDAKGDSEKSQSLYETYLKEYPDDTSVFNEIGCMQLKAEKYEEALYFFQTALNAENVKNEQELRRNEIVAYEYMLDFAAAKDKMERYIADYPEDEAALKEYEFLKTR